MLRPARVARRVYKLLEILLRRRHIRVAGKAAPVELYELMQRPGGLEIGPGGVVVKLSGAAVSVGMTTVDAGKALDTMALPIRCSGRGRAGHATG